jgi:hypothetical protein
MAGVVPHDNWVRVTTRHPLDVASVQPTDDVSALKYIGDLMESQLNAQNVNTLQDLINTLGQLPDQTAVDQWLQAALTNENPYACVGRPLHGQPNRYYIRFVNKFAYNSIVTWLQHWWTTADRYYNGALLPLRPGARRRVRQRLDKLPPLLTDRTAAQAFPPNCAIAPAPAPPPPPPAPPAAPPPPPPPAPWPWPGPGRQRAVPAVLPAAAAPIPAEAPAAEIEFGNDASGFGNDEGDEGQELDLLNPEDVVGAPSDQPAPGVGAEIPGPEFEEVQRKEAERREARERLRQYLARGIEYPAPPPMEFSEPTAEYESKRRVDSAKRLREERRKARKKEEEKERKATIVRMRQYLREGIPYPPAPSAVFDDESKSVVEAAEQQRLQARERLRQYFRQGIPFPPAPPVGFNESPRNAGFFFRPLGISTILRPKFKRHSKCIAGFETS